MDSLLSGVARNYAASENDVGQMINEINNQEEQKQVEPGIQVGN